MKNKALTILIVFFSAICQGQIIDGFNDLDNWSGEKSKFEVLENQLHLNDTAITGKAYLVIPSQISLNATWEFWMKLDFAPSSSNKIEVALMSDNPLINREYKGYYLSIGESGSSDAIEFYRKDGSNNELLGRGIEAKVGVKLDSILIKVKRDKEFNWEIWTDVGNGFELEWAIIDSTYLSSAYFGFCPTYTTTRSDLFYFDNLLITGKAYIDDKSPTILSSELVSENIIRLRFDELLDSSTVEAVKFRLNGVYPEYLQLREATIDLTFEKLISDIELVLEVDGINDLAGNTMFPITQKFQYHKYEKQDLVISELLFNPKVGGVDYIEIYNASGVALESDELKFISFDTETGDTSQIKIIDTNIVLEPFAYYVFTEDKEYLSTNYDIENIDLVMEQGIPTMNDAEGIIGIFKKEQLLDQVYYSEGFHAPFLNDREGVSLERIGLLNSGGKENNWYSASESSGWGTPTKENLARRDHVSTSYQLDTDRISPDGDGYEDFALLSYSSVTLGTLLSVYIYDRNGMKINTLYQNYSIAEAGELKVDAVNPSNRILSPGVYVLLIETFNPNGITESFKRVLTVNARF